MAPEKNTSNALKPSTPVLHFIINYPNTIVFYQLKACLMRTKNEARLLNTVHLNISYFNFKSCCCQKHFRVHICSWIRKWTRGTNKMSFQVLISALYFMSASEIPGRARHERVMSFWTHSVMVYTASKLSAVAWMQLPSSTKQLKYN